MKKNLRSGEYVDTETATKKVGIYWHQIRAESSISIVPQKCRTEAVQIDTQLEN